MPGRASPQDRLRALGGYARRVDANAVRAADRRVLVGYAAAVAGNARDLLADAELVLGARRWARAYALAVLAAEEWGKAYAVITLSFMPPEARAQIPVKDLRKLLEDHRMKMAGALLVRILDAGRPGVADRMARMAGLADVLRAVEQEAGDANMAKQRGLYADLLGDGTFLLPSDVSESEAGEAVARAREVAASAVLLHDQDALERFADPPTDALDLAAGVFAPYLEMSVADADAAAAAVADMASRLQGAGPPQD